MNFTLISEKTGNIGEVALPSSEQEIAEFCVSVSDKNLSCTKVVVSKISNYKELFLLLGRKLCNLDELNFFMKALHSLKPAEKELFFTVATSDSGDSLPFLINLCYNLHCYSVISDFSCLHLMGRALYLSQEEATEENFDNTAFFMKSIEDGKFKITEKGVVFFDKNQWKGQYGAGLFPYLPEKLSPFSLKIAKDEKCEFLNLPTKESALFKLFERLGIQNLKDCTMEVYGLSQFEAVESILVSEFTFQNCNKLAESLSKLRLDEQEDVEELVELVKITSFSELLTLISSFEHFSVLQDVKTTEEYGKYLISRMNHIVFDEKLATFVNFSGYGKEISEAEHGVFTESAYMKYDGYNQEMMGILTKNLGYKTKTGQQSGEMKLYMPVTVQNSDGDTLDLQEKASDVLVKMLQKFLSDYQEKLAQPRGFMNQYPNRDSIHAKVEKYTFDAEIMDRSLLIVAVLDLNDQLNEEELLRMK